jgi:hypothetical protein
MGSPGANFLLLTCSVWLVRFQTVVVIGMNRDALDLSKALDPLKDTCETWRRSSTFNEIDTCLPFTFGWLGILGP